MLQDLREAVARMRTTLEAADPVSAVPACPGWTVSQLVEHVGGVHLWAAKALRSTDDPGWTHPDRPRANQPLADWYAGCAATLLDTLAGMDPAQPAWTFSATDRSAGFWLRRQLHEVTVHRVDVEQAGGEVDLAAVLAPALAADGVDEVLTVMVPRTLVRRRTSPPGQVLPVPRPVALVCPDAERAWTVQLVDGRAVTRPGLHDPVATLTAPAATAYLALWNRVPRLSFAIDGDTTAADALLGAELTP